MTEKITYSISIQVAGGPKLAAANPLDVEAYDKTRVTLVDGDSDKAVNIQPGGAGLARFLAITATRYDDALSYKVNDAGALAVVLNGPHLFIGAGGVGLLGGAPATLFFANATGAEVTVDILVGRDATP